MNVALADHALLLRLYTLAGDRVGGKALAEAVIAAAVEAGLAGATALPGIMGFGRHGFDAELMTSLYNPNRQPVVVEIVDEAEKLSAFLPSLARLNRHRRLVTLERVRVHSYHQSQTSEGGVG